MTLNDLEAGKLIEAVETLKRDAVYLKQEAASNASFRNRITGAFIILGIAEPILTALVVRAIN